MLSSDFLELPTSSLTEGAPLYARLKESIRHRIEVGDWLPDHRVPSENDFVEYLSISRMTANRALRELAAEGVLTRIQGKGSFVAAKKRSSNFQNIPNIATEIVERGHRHSANICVLQKEVCGPDLAEAFSMTIGSSIFHSIIVHFEDDLPIQIEDRYVSPHTAPDYIIQNFESMTPNAYLTSVAPIVQSEQLIEAIPAQPWECRLLSITRIEPCLLIHRRTWAATGMVSSVRLLYPGNRYRLHSFWKDNSSA